MRIVALPVFLALLGALCTACAGDDDASKSVSDRLEEVIPVTVAPLKKVRVQDPYLLSGVFTTDNERYLSFKLGGVINRVMVREGDAFTKGQLLATLDETEIRSQVQMAKIAWEKAGRDVERVRNLYRDSVATLEQFQNAGSAQALAEEQYQTALFNSRFSSITAPAGGFVLRKLADVGQVVGPGNPIFLVNDVAGNTAWVLKVSVSDLQWQSLSKGLIGRILLEDGSEIDARLIRKSAFVDPMSGTLSVEFKPLQIPSALLASGMFGKITVMPNSGRDAYRIPSSALIDLDRQSGFVFVTIDRKKVQKLSITIAGFDKEGMWTDWAFPPGAFLVTQGGPYLKDGAAIRVNP